VGLFFCTLNGYVAGGHNHNIFLRLFVNAQPALAG
jgi:hypothetical protein